MINGNKTSCSPIQSVLMHTRDKQIGLPPRGRPLSLKLVLHSVLLPLLSEKAWKTTGLLFLACVVTGFQLILQFSSSHCAQHKSVFLNVTVTVAG